MFRVNALSITAVHAASIEGKNVKTNAIHEAAKRGEVGRNAIIATGARSMEYTADKSGIVWERFVLPSGVSVVLVQTPHWWDVFSPVALDNLTASTLEAITRLAKKD